MRPTGSMSDSEGVAPNLWHTPIPYLFGGMGAMMALIAVALVVLACSHWKSSRCASAAAAAAAALSVAGEKTIVIPLDMEPRVVVIMAGDDKPTYLAKPFSSSIPQEDARKATVVHLPTPLNGEP